MSLSSSYVLFLLLFLDSVFLILVHFDVFHRLFCLLAYNSDFHLFLLRASTLPRDW